MIKEFLISENNVLMPSLPDDATTTVVCISRTYCQNDLLNFYKDKEIVDTKLDVQFIDELGINGSRLTKEVLIFFFEQCQNYYFQGEDCLVPYLPSNKKK